MSSDSFSIEVGDRSSTEHPKLPIVIILDRLRSVHNVGNILRLADAVNATEVACCGYTACPPHPKLAKASMGAEDIVDTIHFDTAVEAVCHYKAKGFKVFGVDTISEADVIWEFKVDGPIAIVLGNEALGIQEETLNGCDGFIKLPAYGLKNSINVSNCAAVVLFDLAKQFIT